MTRKMKDSGIEWIGMIPKKWKVVPSNLFFYNSSRKVEGEIIQLTASQKYGVISQKRYMELESRMPVQKQNLSDLKQVDKGDFVISLRSFQGGIEIAQESGGITPAYTVLKEKTSETYESYYKYFFKSDMYIQALRGTVLDTIRDGKAIRFSNFSMVSIILPPLEEQKKIVRAIEQSICNINKIISDTQQSTEELKKYKQSLITETVTKGLDKNIEMKDSGVKWIGEIPRHWTVSRPNRVSSIIRGNTSFQKKDMENKGEFVAVQYGQIYKLNELDDKYQLYIDKSFYKKDQVVQKEDTILVSTSETLEDLGHSCFYKRDDLGLLGGEQLCLRPNNEKMFGKFLYYATNYFKYELNQYATGLKLYRFKLDDLNKINIVVPPIKEQYKIVSFLDEQISRIDKLIADKTNVIKELDSYKKSLIYEYVTGKKEV